LGAANFQQKSKKLERTTTGNIQCSNKNRNIKTTKTKKEEKERKGKERKGNILIFIRSQQLI